MTLRRPVSDPNRDHSPLGPDLEVTVEQGTLPYLLGSHNNRREHVVVDPDTLRRLGLARRSNVRLVRPNDAVIAVTVEQVQRHTTPTLASQGWPEGIERFGDGVTFPFEATLQTTGFVNSDMSPEDAEAQGEFAEYLTDDASSTLICISPHGGDIERFTFGQGERFRQQLADLGCVFWGCRGYSTNPSQTAYQRWHITSTDIDPRSFPLLGSVANRGFTHAVSFHGWTGESVEIGGLAPEPFLDEVVAAIQGVVPGGTVVQITGIAEIEGVHPRNIINRLTLGTNHSVQIEQPWEIRRDYGEAVADAVALVFRTHLDPP